MRQASKEDVGPAKAGIQQTVKALDAGFRGHGESGLDRLPDALLVCAGAIVGAPPDIGLRGSRCARCAEVFFPVAMLCTRCGGRDLRDSDLGGAGTLWSWTIQAFAPKAPYDGGGADGFVPYGVGYVELPSGLKVESRLTTADPTQLRIGMPMRLVLERYGRDAAGTPLLTYAFAPG